MISKEKLIVRMSGFGKNSVSKFWKNKKLNVLDMGYTLNTNRFTQVINGSVFRFRNTYFHSDTSDTLIISYIDTYRHIKSEKI